ncbi:MAG: hypothetical protein PVH91_11240 [Pseudomonadales bacterium]
MLVLGIVRTTGNVFSVNLATLRATAFAVAIALLAQSALATASAPCAGSHHAAGPVIQATVTAHADDPHATHHHQATGNAHGSHDADQRPDCCRSMSGAGCAAGDCALSAGALLIPALPEPWTACIGPAVRPAHGWLPPYGSPPSGIFRPPIV